jgi:hypothetical protein
VVRKFGEMGWGVLTDERRETRGEK